MCLIAVHDFAAICSKFVLVYTVYVELSFFTFPVSLDVYLQTILNLDQNCPFTVFNQRHKLNRCHFFIVNKELLCKLFL